LGNDTLHGQAGGDEMIGGEGDDRLYGREGSDRLSGDAGNDRIYGGEGNDSITGGSGDDRLDGGPGDDVYAFARGDGKDRILPDDGADATADHDSLVFAGAVTPDQIWFSPVGNDLLAQLIGSEDQVRLSGWYSDGQKPVDTFVAGEDQSILADQVDRLVSAVAGFGVARAAVIELSPTQQTEYSAMVTAYWGASAGTAA
jgi:Ca2+-binding RTX toxin-like protein